MKSMSAWLHGCNQTALTNNLPLSQNNLPLSGNNGRLSNAICYILNIGGSFHRDAVDV
jgi:hypothetical protein